jgi:hypothetical protein
MLRISFRQLMNSNSALPIAYAVPEAVDLAFAALQHTNWAINRTQQLTATLPPPPQQQQQHWVNLAPMAVYADMCIGARQLLLHTALVPGLAMAVSTEQADADCHSVFALPRYFQAAATASVVIGGYASLLAKLAQADIAVASRRSGNGSSGSGSSETNAGCSDQARLQWQIACQHQQQLPALPAALKDMLGVDRLLLAWLAARVALTGVEAAAQPAIMLAE